DALLQKTQTAIAQRKRALETFQTLDSLIKQDKLAEARRRLDTLKSSELLTDAERAQIVEVLGQLDLQMADDQAHIEKVEDRKLLAAQKLEKIAEGIRKPGDQLRQRNEKIAEVYRQSMNYYRAGQLAKARAGFVKVAASSLIPPLMKKTIEGYIARIDRLLPERITSEPPAEQDEPALVLTVEPKVAEPDAAKLTLAQPRLSEAEAAEPAPVSAEPVAAPEPAPSASAAAAASEGSYIDKINKKRNILRTYTATVVNDADAKARIHMGKGEFDKATRAVEAAAFVVNENQIDLGAELYKAHMTRLTALNEEIVALVAEKAQLTAEQKRQAAAAEQTKFREQAEIDRQKRIAELMENAIAYQKQQRYEAALGQLVSLLALDPQNDEALIMKDLLDDIIHFRKQLDVEREMRRATSDMLLKTEESQIPYPGEITYPKNWREIVERPTRQPDKPIGLDPADAAVYDQLETIVDLSNLTQSMTIEDVVRELENSVDPPLQIQPNWKDLLEIAELEPTTPAMMDALTGIKLRKALEVLVAGISSDFAVVDYVVDEGVIIIATEEALPQKMVTRVYDITDLVGEPAQYGGIQGLMMGRMVSQMSGGGQQGGLGGGLGGGGFGGGGLGGGGLGGFGGGGLGGGGLGGFGGGGLGGFGGGGLGGGGLGGFGGGGLGGGGFGGGGLGGGGLGGGGLGGGGFGGGMMGGGMMGGGMMGGMGGMGGMMQAQSLVQLVQESIEPDSWFDLSDTGEGTVTPYPMQQPKKLAIYNTHEVHEEVEKLLTSLRKALGHQVSIEARFLVVSENFLEDIGLDVDFSINAGTHWGQITFEQESTSFTNPEPTGIPLSLGGLGASASLEGGYGSILDDLQVSFLLRATQAHRDAKALDAPLATVLSGESASFNVNRQMIFALPPIQTPGVTQVSGTAGTTTAGQGNVPQYLPINPATVLSITPIITHDKKNVLLGIITTQNRFLGMRTTTIETPIVGGAQPGQVVSYDVQLPDQESSSMMTRVSVPDRGTVLLGGQRLTEEVETEAGVPVLSKIPLLGRLFRNRSVVKDSKILLILVKPVIILQEETEAEAIAAMEGM
ncbi:MAG: hypothetical protein ACYTBS_12650, partial [Planctomycetota bacterium]